MKSLLRLRSIEACGNDMFTGISCTSIVSRCNSDFTYPQSHWHEALCEADAIDQTIVVASSPVTSCWVEGHP
jgi:hypothetical protein